MCKLYVIEETIIHIPVCGSDKCKVDVVNGGEISYVVERCVISCLNGASGAIDWVNKTTHLSTVIATDISWVPTLAPPTPLAVYYTATLILVPDSPFIVLPPFNHLCYTEKEGGVWKNAEVIDTCIKCYICVPRVLKFPIILLNTIFILFYYQVNSVCLSAKNWTPGNKYYKLADGEWEMKNVEEDGDGRWRMEKEYK